MDDRCVTKEELIQLLEAYLREIKNDDSLVSFHRSYRTFDIGDKIFGSEIFYLGRKIQ